MKRIFVFILNSHCVNENRKLCEYKYVPMNAISNEISLEPQRRLWFSETEYVDILKLFHSRIILWTKISISMSEIPKLMLKRG